MQYERLLATERFLSVQEELTSLLTSLGFGCGLFATWQCA